MKILVLADVESKYLWDFYEKSKLEGIDLIISCGDLKANYLSFLATFTSAPVLYVHGNHDTKYETHPPEGCICIDDDIYVTWLYVHEGQLYEQFTELDEDFNPLDGTEICPANSLAAELKDGLLTVSLTDEDDVPSTVQVALRCA